MPSVWDLLHAIEDLANLRNGGCCRNLKILTNRAGHAMVGILPIVCVFVQLSLVKRSSDMLGPGLLKQVFTMQ